MSIGPPSSRLRRDAALVATGLSLLLLLPVAVLIVTAGWDGVYGQDAFWYHAFASGELRSALLDGRAPAPFSWPPGFPLLAALASLLTGPTTLAGQLVSLGAGALVPVLTWALARELRWPGGSPAGCVAVLAGVLMATVPHLWQSSAVVMSDTTGLAAMTLGAWALARWANGGGLRWAILAAAAIAFAMDTRQVYVLAGAPLAVAGVVVGWRRTRAATSPGLVRTLGLPLLAGAAVLAPVVGSMAWAAARGESVPFSIQLASHPWDPANLLRTAIASRDGLGRFALPMGLFYLVEAGRSYHLGPAFAIAALLGIVRVLRRPALMPVAILVAWPAVVIAFLGGDVTQNTRYILAALPPIAILAAMGVAAIVDVIAGRIDGPAGRLALAGAGAIVVIAVTANLLAAWRLTDDFIARFQADRAAIAALDAQVPTDDRLIAFGATLALRFAGRDALELHDLEPPDGLALAADARRTWLVIPTGALSGQWAATHVARTFEALRDGPGVRMVARAGAWELWSVGPAHRARTAGASGRTSTDVSRR